MQITKRYTRLAVASGKVYLMKIIPEMVLRTKCDIYVVNIYFMVDRVNVRVMVFNATSRLYLTTLVLIDTNYIDLTTTLVLIRH